MLRLISFALTVLLVQAFVHALYNPILQGFNPDPTIIRVGADYFISTSTFEQFPGHPIYHSKNLVDWDLIGHALNRPSQLALFGTHPGGGSWAPTLRYNNGIFYLVTAVRYVDTAALRLFPRPFFVTTEDIFSNSWSDPIYFDSLGYDAELFWDVNGDVYSTWAGINNAEDQIYGIYQNKVDLKTGDSLAEVELISPGVLPSNSSSRPEGPHIYLNNGTYYLILAEGGTDLFHQVTVQRGPSPSGPWQSNPLNPILYNGADPSLPVQQTGHADLVELEDGSWFGIALGTRPHAGNHSHKQLGRESFLFPVTWEDGWPVFNGGAAIGEHIEGILEDRPPVTEYFNDFMDTDALDLSFYYERTPYKPFHTLAERPGYLRIKGNAYAPGDRDSPALLLRRQSSYNETFEVQIDFKPTSNLTEAGISAFTNEHMHNDIAIIGDEGRNGNRYILTRTLTPAKQVGPWALTFTNTTIAVVEKYELKSRDQPVKLRIVTNATTYSLGYAEGDTDFVYRETFDSSSLSVRPSSVSWFTGAMFGAYSTGSGRSTLVPADFKYWKQVS